MSGTDEPVIEYDDRWIVRPLRRRVIRGIRWAPDRVELICNPFLAVVVGLDARLSPVFHKDDPRRHPITYWSKQKAAQLLATPILSAVFFKSGHLRFGFENGWNLTSARQPERPPCAYTREGVLWDGSVWHEHPGYRVVAVDKWSGQVISAPPWPMRPPELGSESGSRDING